MTVNQMVTDRNWNAFSYQERKKSPVPGPPSPHDGAHVDMVLPGSLSASELRADAQQPLGGGAGPCK